MEKRILLWLLSVFFILLMGCSTLGGQGNIRISPSPHSTVKELVSRLDDVSLTTQDKIDIVDGIKRVHTGKNIPDTWDGGKFSVSHERFGLRADGTYCMIAGVKLGGQELIPPTPLCKLNGEWTVVEQSELMPSPVVSAAKKAKEYTVERKAVSLVNVKNEPVTVVKNEEANSSPVKAKKVVFQKNIRNRPAAHVQKSTEKFREIR